jgi:hypothetical protein
VQTGDKCQFFARFLSEKTESGGMWHFGHAELDGMGSGKRLLLDPA